MICHGCAHPLLPFAVLLRRVRCNSCYADGDLMMAEISDLRSDNLGICGMRCCDAVQDIDSACIRLCMHDDMSLFFSPMMAVAMSDRRCPCNTFAYLLCPQRTSARRRLVGEEYTNRLRQVAVPDWPCSFHFRCVPTSALILARRRAGRWPYMNKDDWQGMTGQG